ncbi:transposase [Sansalvadorimonas verongulae]|uniref:transposase n=1 Tax=Sansalvadorimonas verongulae TaxID=2172824 RepID=UPI0012BC3FBB|nr:transposase [Sansalvadorimonas verongulae]MTI11952.1 transposase [Sansalvadorimonas verongulae]
MTSARNTLIDAQTTPYYHCIARCVRRAFLCGEDHVTGTSYEHRKPWIVDRLKELAGIFAIEVCAYAVMSNHYHTVLHINAEQAKGWSTHAVLARWTQLFKGPFLVQRYLAGESLDKAEYTRVEEYAEGYRERLQSISWFMRCLNEYLARKANEEDDCKGRFWEGRFKSQALLDEAAVLSCMAYVDLNPVRAGLADSPEASDFTSLQERIEQYRVNGQQAKSLKPLQVDNQQKGRIPFALTDYFQFVDWTGRALRGDKRGAIASELPPILHRLGIDAAAWLQTVRPGKPVFIRAIGRAAALKEYAESVGKGWLHGTGVARRVFGG